MISQPLSRYGTKYWVPNEFQKEKTNNVFKEVYGNAQ